MSVSENAKDEVAVLKNKAKWLSTLSTAIGNFSIQYNFQAISIALIVMSASQCSSNESDCKDGKQDSWVTTTATATVFIGAITGQLVMGYAGDILGRNSALVFTLSLVSISALLSALASQGSPTSVYATIIFFRFLLGIGAGGVYPLSATKAAEDGGGSKGVDIIAASYAFFWQVPGSMAPWLLALILASADDSSPSLRWRLILALGALPSMAVVLFTLLEMQAKRRVQVLSGQEVTVGRTNDAAKRERDDAAVRSALSKRETWTKLIATGGGWFLYDVAYYGVNLFGGTILSKISDSDDDNVSDNGSVRRVTQQQLIALSMGIPACICSILILQYKVMNTFWLQIVGFLFIAFCFVLLAVLFVPLRDSSADGLFTIYCFLLFSLSFGPNLTTYVLPAQTFPKNVRATLNGISAAAGKLGAFAGVYLFGSMGEVTSYPVVMVVCAILCVIGAVISYFFIDYYEEDLSIDSSSHHFLDDDGKTFSDCSHTDSHEFGHAQVVKQNHSNTKNPLH